MVSQPLQFHTSKSHTRVKHSSLSDRVISDEGKKKINTLSIVISFPMLSKTFISEKLKKPGVEFTKTILRQSEDRF